MGSCLSPLHSHCQNCVDNKNRSSQYDLEISKNLEIEKSFGCGEYGCPSKNKENK